MDMSKYKDLFISEAREHIQGINDCILVLEKDAENTESINELFRHAHSVKGMSASMGYSAIAGLSHRLEDMMDIFRQGSARISPPVVDILFQGIDFLDGMVKAVEDDSSADDLDTTGYLNDIQKIIDGRLPEESDKGPENLSEPVPAAEGTSSAEPAPQAMEEELAIVFRISDTSPVPAVRAYLAIKRLGKLGEIVSVSPSLDEIKAGGYSGEVSMVVTGTDRPAVEKLLKNSTEMGEFTVSSLKSGKKPKPAPAVTESVPPKTRYSAPAPAASKSVRINTQLLDTFINLVGELIVTKSRLRELSKESGSTMTDQVLTRLDHLVGTLHGEVMKVRMDPMESVTKRLPRVVRDLGRKEGKEISLVIEGAQIELDRAILEELGDPLVHILRNAVDHGIEDTGERERAGKPKMGNITISISRERDMVYVNIVDDGRGMNLKKISAKAIQKGIISEEQARVMSEEDAIMLICRPGFSTADKVTDVSGRGVGMDVVQAVVESLGGTLAIESNSGTGSRFTLKLPLTVAIVKMLLIQAREHIFAIPITRVVRTTRVAGEDVKESQGRFYITLDEDLVPLHFLRKMLSLPGPPDDNGLLTVVVVEVTNRMVGIAVDGVSGQADIVVKPLCYPLERLVGYSGMTVLGSGKIVPVLDLGNLL